MLLTSAIIASCESIDMTVRNDEQQPFEISEAQECFDQLRSQLTRSSATPDRGFTPGEITVDWDSAIRSEADALYSIDVPITTGYDYIVSCDSVVMRTHSQLVSVKDKASGSVRCYIRLNVPAPEYALTHKMDCMQKLTNTGRQDDFSGLVVYLSLDGIPLYALDIRDGNIVLSTSIFDEENDPDPYAMRYILHGFSFMRIDNVTTRTIDGGTIDDVIIMAYNYETGQLVDLDVLLHRNLVNTLRYLEMEGEGDIDPFEDMGGGSNSSGGDSKIKTINWNKNIKIVGNKIQNENVSKNLNSIRRIPVFINVMKKLEEMDVVIIIQYSSDCPYEANAKSDGTITYRCIDSAGQLLEEIFHIFQWTNNSRNERTMSQIDKEFEAKYVVATCLENGSLKSEPQVASPSRSHDFWSNYIQYVRNPSDKLKEDIYKYLKLLGYKGAPQNGHLLPNYNEIKHPL